VKKFVVPTIIGIILVGIFVPSVKVFADAESDCRASGGSWNLKSTAEGGSFSVCEAKPAPPGAINGPGIMDTIGAGVDLVASPIFRGVGYIMMTLSALLLSISGALFDFVLQKTVLGLSESLGSGQNGLGTAMTATWATLRDLANIFLIFLLLYTAFRSMFQLSFANVGTTIRNIVLVALIINFMPFLTKIPIDASNIVAIGFYKSIDSTNTYTLGIADSGEVRGISGAYMRLLGIQNFYNPGILTERFGQLSATNILIMGVMSSIFFLVAAVAFLIPSFMFISRFIILVFGIVVSALAVMAAIIPGQNKHFETWMNAIVHQCIWPVLYFALTWAGLKIASSPGFLGFGGGHYLSGISTQWTDLVMNSPTSSIGLVMNYILVIGFSIGALVIAKQVAGKSLGFTAITAGIAGGAVGATAWGMRNTVGKYGKSASENNREEWSKTRSGRAKLWLANQGARSSFDMRDADTLKKIPGLGGELAILGKAGGKGGYAGAEKEKAKQRAAYAKETYGATDKEKDLESEKKGAYEKLKKVEDERIKDEKKAHMDVALAADRAELDRLREQKKEAMDTLNQERRAGVDSSQSKTDVDRLMKVIEDKRAEITDHQKKVEESAEYKAKEVYSTGTIAAQKEYLQAQTPIKAAEARINAYATRAAEGKPGIVSRHIKAGAAGAVAGGLVGTAVAGPLGTAIGAAGGFVSGVTGMKLRWKPGSKIPRGIGFEEIEESEAVVRAIKGSSKEKSKADKIIDLLKDEQKATEEAKATAAEKLETEASEGKPEEQKA